MRSTFLPYCRPSLGEDEIASVAESLRNGWLTSGPKVQEFEREFAAASGVQHAIALSSCTAALHVALHAMGVGANDEVVMPSLTFVAGAQCTLELGATPVFADVDPETLSVTLETIQSAVSPKTKVIVTMPYAGRPLDVKAIVDFARERSIRVLEDAAHATGMLDRGTWAGTHSDAAAYSFYATKNLTTGEGGMLLTNDHAIAERARVLSLHGMSRDAWKRYTSSGSWRYDVVEPGFKYNLADPLAALGVAQFRRLAKMQQQREAIAGRYRAAFGELRGIRLQALPANDGDRHSWCMFAIRIDQQRKGIERDNVIAALREQQIGTSVHYIPTHRLSGYRHLHVQPLPNTERVWRQLVSLPLYPGMSDADASDVIQAVERCVSNKVFALGELAHGGGPPEIAQSTA